MGKPKHTLDALRAALVSLCLTLATLASALPTDSIVHITAQRWSVDYSMPWRVQSMQPSTGSGIYLGKGKVLTNAHVVQNPMRIRVSASHAASELRAELSFLSEESDLALLRLDPAEAESIFTPIRMGKPPKVGDKVTALGFPSGFTSQAATQGIISRIDDESYSHTSRSLPLLQVDAAINGGSSGGALLVNGKLVGVTFQHAPDLEGVGHAIPLGIIRQFLEDIEDGAVDGLPNLGIQTRPVLNPSKRAFYGLGQDQYALEIIEVSGHARQNGLEEGDLIMAFNGTQLGRDGSISGFPGLQMTMAVAHSQMGEKIWLKIKRNGQTLTRNITLAHRWTDHFLVPIAENESPPAWLNVGGVILIELDEGYREGRDSYPSFLRYLSNQYLETGDDCPSSAVIVANVLPHDVNSGYDYWIHDQVVEINGAKVQNFQHLNYLVNSAKNPWIEMVTSPYRGRITMSREDMLQANAELEKIWGLPAASHPAPPSSLEGICH